MEEILNYISNIGFPIVVSVYLLVRFEKKIDVLTKSIDQLGDAVGNLIRL
ncbi:MAG: YvrJ family protein [Epulopiscium sp.]|nr:YvrJ family protein [Candidatus Epulonipiscium sp.]